MIQIFPVEVRKVISFAPEFRLGVHEGTDIFAPEGSKILAVTDGVARRSVEGLGGLVVYLTGDDGRKYFYAHLSAYTDDTRSSYRVSAGDVIGYVGTSGNAEFTSPHLHFGIYNPRAVDPYPELSTAFEVTRSPLVEASHGS